LGLRLFPACPWVPDTSQRRICLCDHSFRARADGSDWSDCVENEVPTAWTSFQRHCCPYVPSAYCGPRTEAVLKTGRDSDCHARPGGVWGCAPDPPVRAMFGKPLSAATTCEVARECLGRFSAAVATSREDQRSPRSGQEARSLPPRRERLKTTFPANYS
jgi:hypothetical protein